MIKTVQGEEAVAYSDQEFAFVKQEVELHVQSSRDRGMLMILAHPCIIRLIATVEKLQGHG